MISSSFVFFHVLGLLFLTGWFLLELKNESEWVKTGKARLLSIQKFFRKVNTSHQSRMRCSSGITLNRLGAPFNRKSEVFGNHSGLDSCTVRMMNIPSHSAHV